MIHVVCLKHGDKYGPEYVNHLFNAVIRNTKYQLGWDFTFTCYTDIRTGINGAIRRMPLPRKDLTGWWHKLWFFSPEFAETFAGRPGRILYIDLDMVIIRSIDDYMNFDTSPLGILRDMGGWGNPKEPAKDKWGSAIMSWELGWGHFIWKSFSRDVGMEMRGHGHGDQGYIKYIVPPGDVTFWQDICTGRIPVSYKWQMRDPDRSNKDPTPPKNCAVVVFHGIPRPHEVTNLEFVQQHWK